MRSTRTSKAVQDFVGEVCKEIRFRSVHAKISKELRDHIEDQKGEYLQQGFSEEVATSLAIEQMGDPSLVGKQFNRTYQPKTEWSILLITALLISIGGVIQFFVSSQMNTIGIHSFSYFVKYVPIGIVIFAGMYFFNYTWFVRHSRVIYFSLIFITLVGFYMFSLKMNGSYFHVQYLSLLLIPVLAGVIYSYRNKGWLGIFYSYMYYGVAAYLCLIAPSSSALVLLTVSYLIILTVAVARGAFGNIRRFVLPLIYTLTLLILGLPMATTSYRLLKLKMMFRPELDPLGAGYLQTTVQNIITSSKPIGASFIGNMTVEEILPSWTTDFSLTYLIAKIGYIPGMTIIVILLMLIARMFSSVLKQKNTPAFLVACAACLAIAGQIIFYLLTNLGLIMPLSFYLPFVSYGAYGFMMNMALMGLLLSVYRRTNIVAEEYPN